MSKQGRSSSGRAIRLIGCMSCSAGLRVLKWDERGSRILRELGTGAALGELALLTGELRSATVQAVRDSVLLELDGDTFHELLHAIDVICRLEGVDKSEVPTPPSITATLSRATVLGSVERAESNRRLADLVVTPDLQDVAMRLQLEAFVTLSHGSRAQRKPAKTWRRPGRSQLRKLVRAAIGSVAQEPPRSTRYSSPK